MVSGVTIKVCASEDPFEISQFLLLLLSGGKGRRHVQVVVNLHSEVRVVPAEGEAGDGAGE